MEDKKISKNKVLKLIRDIFYMDGLKKPLINIYKIEKLEREVNKL